MAKKKNKKAVQKKFPAKRYALFFLICAAVFLPTTILFLVCMLPTIVANFVDRKPQKTLGITVGCMNFTGTLPAWMELLQGGHTKYLAVQIISEPMVLVLAYGAAAVGWLIYYNITPFVATIVLSRAKRRIKSIDEEKERLENQWGTDVSEHLS